MKVKTKFLAITLGSLLLLGLGASYFIFFANYSQGMRAGTVVKLSKKGALVKTFEGQLNLGGRAGSNSSDVNSIFWEFSVAPGDDEIRQALEEALDQGYRVKLLYNEKFMRVPWKGDTKYFIYKVERIGVK